MSHEPMHRVIRLKRYEKPPEGYFDNFLRDFHRRQRAELLKPSLATLLLERLHGILGEIRVPAMAYAGATVVAVVASIAILGLPGHSQGEKPRAFAASPAQATRRPALPPLRRAGQCGRGRPFPIKPFILNARPANHESPLSF